jgi:hypothetical protein
MQLKRILHFSQRTSKTNLWGTETKASANRKKKHNKINNPITNLTKNTVAPIFQNYRLSRVLFTLINFFRPIAYKKIIL